MKLALSYLLVGIYALLIIKPVMPSITDTVEHILNYQEHMATVHYENGQYHVHYEYIAAGRKNAANGDAKNSTSNTVKSPDTFEHIWLETNCTITHTILHATYTSSSMSPLFFIAPQPGLRPPIELA